ncbi:hypothetical protein ES319_A04G118900v1 [Gossypium barbadense]|uniref:Uncharacterized protein n=2 Tax=Gossypium TaxID=3633 RepID=A0A5J5W6B0_GOSBA|nr:hypothetical protein ES319_A04G118900v1 [Gossypium barbadense]TYH22490.1 hypothetical protein ES288_A04G133100v1 [Gossypium darwinii]
MVFVETFTIVLLISFNSPFVNKSETTAKVKQKLLQHVVDDVCQLRINSDVQKPLKREIFVTSDNNFKS